MPLPGASAGVVVGVELPTGGRALRVNGATYRPADFAVQRHTTGSGQVSAKHAAQVGRKWNCLVAWHTFCPSKGPTSQLRRVKVDPEGGTAGTAAQAGVPGIRVFRHVEPECRWPSGRR